MDLTSQETIERKRAEARAGRELARNKRAEADRAKDQARRKQREEENMDKKAEKAQNHSEELRRGREQAVAQIERCHRHIDRYNADSRDYERRIDEHRVRIRRQQDTIRLWRQEAIALRLDADLLRTEADMACMEGAMERETYGTSNKSKHKELLSQAEVKQREAMHKDREAEEADRAALAGERNSHQLCDSLLAIGRMRGDVEKEKEEQEKRAADMGEKLATYKIEVANCFFLARSLRAEEAGLEEMYYKLDEEADWANRNAALAEEEADRLERELAGM